MALADLKCTGCGAPLTARGNTYVCPYCGTTVVQIADAHVDANVQLLSPEEFRTRLEASRKTFVMAPGGGGVCDIDDAVLKGKLAYAAQLLHEHKAYEVSGALKGIPETVFEAERLRFLAEIGVRDETELAAYAGDIRQLPHYQTLLAAGNGSCRETYTYISGICLENARILEEIGKGMELLSAAQIDQALAYGEQMVRQYPSHARAWELLIAARCAKDGAYDPFADLGYLLACPDAELTVTGGEMVNGIPRYIAPGIADRCHAIRQKRERSGAFVRDFLIRPLLLLLGIGALIGIWQLITFLISLF